jgi:hypothetical protein
MTLALYLFITYSLFIDVMKIHHWTHSEVEIAKLCLCMVDCFKLEDQIQKYYEPYLKHA